MSSFFNALPGAVTQGLIWGVMAIGLYITYKVLEVSDLTVDGSFCTGGAVCVMMMLAGCNVWVAMLAAMLVLAGSSVLNAMYYLPAIVGIWFPADETKAEPMAVEKSDVGFMVSTVIFLVLNVVLGVAIEPTIRMIELGLRLL